MGPSNLKLAFEFINSFDFLNYYRYQPFQNGTVTTQSTLGEQQWDLLVSEHSVGFQIKIGRPKFYAGEMITLA